MALKWHSKTTILPKHSAQTTISTVFENIRSILTKITHFYKIPFQFSPEIIFKIAKFP